MKESVFLVPTRIFIGLFGILFFNLVITDALMHNHERA